MVTTTPHDLPNAFWLKNADIATIYNAFINDNSDLMLVGGAVRNFLMQNQKQSDFDFATPMQPERIVALLKSLNFHFKLHGFDHGTIMVLADKTAYEITTLRKDTKTDGRHSQVEFLTSWEQDAHRRDFTINSLFMDSFGKIYDYCNGINDLKNKIIKFIGDPNLRINEDYLRILRLFRFYSSLNQFSIDNASLKACADLKKGYKNYHVHVKQMSLSKYYHQKNHI